MPAKHDDPRWGGYIPFFFRHPDFGGIGDYETFFERVGHRLKQLISYNEAGLTNLPQFGDRLESDSHQRFRFNPERRCDIQLQEFFTTQKMNEDINAKVATDPEIIKAAEAMEITRDELSRKINWANAIKHPSFLRAASAYRETVDQHRQVYRQEIIAVRIGVMETLLRIIATSPNGPSALTDLIASIRGYLAETEIMLDIRETPPLIVPLEGPLFRKEVLDRLLPRLQAKYPERAQDLIKAYHDLLQGTDTNTVFGNAFKALEEIARSLANDRQLLLNKPQKVKKAFPMLHETIIATITKLADHRGDEGGHARKGPDPYEMRYLLLTICNIALLLMECQDAVE